MYFSTGGPTPTLTIPSALSASLRLGMNLPLALLASLSIRILYGDFPYFHSTPVASIPHHKFRTQLESVELTQPSYTQEELVALCERVPDDGTSRRLNETHIGTLWMLVADNKTGKVDVEDIRRFQQGEWAEEVEKRRKSRVPGKGEVLPVLRGGPIIVAAHSWAVNWLFGVEVYQG